MKQETLDKWIYQKNRKRVENRKKFEHTNNPYEDLIKEIGKNFMIVEKDDVREYVPKNDKGRKLYGALKANGLEWLILLAEPYMDGSK